MALGLLAPLAGCEGELLGDDPAVDASLPTAPDASPPPDAGRRHEGGRPAIDGGAAEPDGGAPDAPRDAGPPPCPPCGPYEACESGACVALPYGLSGRVTSTPCRISDPPERFVSETGCYADVARREPAAGLVPYSVNSLLWADGTGKRRFLVIPPGETIGYADEGAWELPVGAILVKEFLLERVAGDPSSTIALETRFLVRRDDGWDGYTYRWNEEQTEAERFWGGRGSYAVTTADGASDTYTHWFPSSPECELCHDESAGVALGMRTVQMNRAFDYDGIVDNQLRALDNAGYFAGPLPDTPTRLPSMPDPTDASAPLALRARSYLEGNCAHCHRPGGRAERALDLRYERPFAATNTCDVLPETETFGIPDARIVAPGEPDRSVLLTRVGRRGWAQMPLVGTLRVDEAATALLGDWISAMTDCP